MPAERRAACTLALFAKAPVAGQAKTRLIPLLGPEGAARAHEQMTRRALALLRGFAAQPGAQAVVWAAGDARHPLFETSALPVQAQCDGDLGARMRHCIAAHRGAGHVIVIGSDCPALDLPVLTQVRSHLDAGAALAFVPASDGGYVLVAARAQADDALLDSCFSGIAWSTAEVMPQTRAALAATGLRPERDWVELPALWDVDEPADYRRALAAGLLSDR